MRFSSFFCVSVDKADRENHSVSLWDLITDMEVELQRGEDKRLLVEFILARFP